ncbi:MAG TPA: protein kinase [Candidatus Paceibacterota bacterium]|nr:protein kinase [Verrucomicrobiota bacterium]HRY50879.1 protein kinase [Candidatus Paceibacterota bacterium]HSA02091.1 protein kinase [Candidatus Paceibacterota bacterium]
MPNNDRMNREREIFLEALEQPSKEARAAFIERVTAGDPKLREAVEALLENNEADTLLEQGPAVLLRESLAAAGKLTLQDEQIGDSIGRYRLLEKIGEGGFGVVYRAEQREPVRRHVAVKVIKLGMDTKSVVARFEAERQALALMDHPSIARVLDGGATDNGRPFFVMELVRGVRITDYCQANQLSLSERLALLIQLCHAIQHAHQKGVIHRDLKPSNVLVTVQDGKPVPKVIDFGVAKAIEEPLTEKTVLTNFHAFIGTPAYTSPEQAGMSAVDVDTRSDIYSLGVLLYELLTGATPFDAKELTQSGLDGMRRMIKEVDPPKPSTRLRRAVADPTANPSIMLVDRDLDWIVMKCLEKDRARRYETALELAVDLQRYLNQEPVLARPQSRAYRLGKAFRRHRAAFAAAAAILLAVVAGTTVSVWQAWRATHAEHAAEQARINEEMLRHSAEKERERALESQDKAELNEYVANINLAHQSVLAGNLARAKELLAKHHDRGSQRFEWRYLWNAAQGDGHRLLAQESSSIQSLANSPEFLVVGLQDSVRIYDPKTGSLVKTLPKSGFSVALSTAGLLATASKSTIRVWRTSDWSEAFSVPEHMAPIAFSADGRWLAANSLGGVHVFNSSDGKLVADIPSAMAPFAFHPQGDVIAVNSNKGTVLWDLAASKTLCVLDHSEGIFADVRMRFMNALAFSPDGNSLIAARNVLREGSIFVLDVWSCATGKKVSNMPATRDLVEHAGMVSGIAFSPGGQVLASASHDHSIRLWDFGTRQCLERLYGNPSEVWAVAFTGDGKGIISGAKDGTVRLWPTNTASRERFIEGNWTPIKLSKDGRELAAIDDQSKFVLLNLRTGEPSDQLQLAKSPRGLWTGAISDDLRVLVNPLPDGSIRVWDLQSRKSVEIRSREISKPGAPKSSADMKGLGIRQSWTAVSPDGTALLTGSGKDSMLWWNLEDLSEEPARLEGKGALFSRNGNVLITFHDQSIKTWNPKTRSLKAELRLEADLGFFAALALSDDGNTLAVGSNPLTETENAIHLWDLCNGKLLGVCRGHTQGVRWLAFAPDGETLASVSDDSTLRFWNLRTQQELLPIRRLADPIRDILFSPDGHWLAAKTATGLRLLDASPDREPAKTTVPGHNSTIQ